MIIGRIFSKKDRTFYKVDIEKYKFNGDYIFVYEVDQRKESNSIRRTTSTKYTTEYLAGLKAEPINSDNILEGTIVEGGDDNIFNSLDISLVRSFFHRLVDKVGKSGKPFITKYELDLFLDRAFLGNKTIPPIQMNTIHGDAYAVRSLFYIFYRMCKDNGFELDKKARQVKYENLLKDNFTNYGNESDVSNNFYFKPKAKGNIWGLEPNSKFSEI